MTTKTTSIAAFTAGYEALNPEQRRAVDTIEGPVMVVAGPGTGKTTMLTLRIAKILLETDAAPEDVLALTFTNSGVKAMRQKLRTYIGDDAYRVGIYTFHSFAEHVLSEFAPYFPAQEFATVIDDLERTKLIEEIIESGSFAHIRSEYDPFSSLSQVVKAIDEIKQEGLTPEAYALRIAPWEEELMNDESMFYKRAFKEFNAGDRKPAEVSKVEKRVAKAREIAVAYERYQALLRERNRYDFTDMILIVLTELSSNAELKADLQEQYRYVLVDEHQDTNDGQNQLIEHLTDAEHLSGRPNLFTVGDEKQSIYRFQGASAESFAYLELHYQDVERITLDRNYRSAEPVLAAAHELIVRSVPDATALTAHTPTVKPVSVGEFSSYQQELLFVVADIERQLAAGVSPDEIALIYRSNKHLKDIKLLFDTAGVPYQVLSKDTLFDDPVIEMFLTVLRTIADPGNERALGTALFAPYFDHSSLKNTEQLRAYRNARRSEGTLSLTEFLARTPAYQPFLAILDELMSTARTHSFVEFFKLAADRSGFLPYLLARPDGQRMLGKLETLFGEVKRQSELTRRYTLNDFLAFVDATVKYNLDVAVKQSGRAHGVVCMTAHKSKGLEFAHVYLINTTRSNWEKSRGFPKIALPIEGFSGELDDERRLFYVAMTRAKTHLTITSAATDWQGKVLEPSQFISELSENAVESLPIAELEATAQAELVRFFSTVMPEESIFDTDYLRERFLEDNVSVTALNNYLRCPRLYLVRNLLQLPDTYTPALRYGDTIHQALERYFRAVAKAGCVLPLERLLEHYQAAMEKSGFSEADEERFRAKGSAALAAYYEARSATFSPLVELETYIRRTLTLLDGTELTLSGKLDKIEFLKEPGTGPVRVVDYKTGKTYSKKSNKAQREDLDRQIRFYHLLLETYKEGTYHIEEAVLDFVEPNDDGTFEQKTLTVAKADLTALTDDIAAMAGAVMDGSFLANGCEQKDCEACRLWATIHGKA